MNLLEDDFWEDGQPLFPPHGKVTGKSVAGDVPSDAPQDLGSLSSFWPYSLPSYLHRYVGGQVELELLPAPLGGPTRRSGRLTCTGNDFVGIQPQNSHGLELIPLEHILSIHIPAPQD